MSSSGAIRPQIRQTNYQSRRPPGLLVLETNSTLPYDELKPVTKCRHVQGLQDLDTICLGGGYFIEDILQDSGGSPTMPCHLIISLGTYLDELALPPSQKCEQQTDYHVYISASNPQLCVVPTILPHFQVQKLKFNPT